jgi:hypothetical protein
MNSAISTIPALPSLKHTRSQKPAKAGQRLDFRDAPRRPRTNGRDQFRGSIFFGVCTRLHSSQSSISSTRRFCWSRQLDEREQHTEQHSEYPDRLKLYLVHYRNQIASEVLQIRFGREVGQDMRIHRLGECFRMAALDAGLLKVFGIGERIERHDSCFLISLVTRGGGDFGLDLL